MANITELINQSTTRQDPGFVTGSIVGIVVGRGGQVLYQNASGVGPSEDQAASPDDVYWLASQSKLMCAVAVMQTVERGLIGLDDDVSPFVPELAALEVLDGGEDANGVPTTKPRVNKITLRLLLSHQSGVGYDLMPMSLVNWARLTGFKYTTLDNTGIPMKTVPLAFEPGTSWTYGASIDWAAEVVARVNKTTLEEFYRTNIWEPLKMTHSTFQPLKLREHIVQAFERDATGKVTAKELKVPKDSLSEMGGHGVWGSPSDYIKLLSALLDDGGPILSKKSVDEMLSPQMLHPDSLQEMVQGIFKPVLGPSIPPSTKIDHGLCGVINLEEIPGRRAKDSVQWSGAPNLIWWIDRNTGIAATAFLQLMPPGDALAGQFNVNFEEQVYRAFGLK